MGTQLIIIQIVTFIAILIALRFFYARSVNTALRRLQSLQRENEIIEEKLKTGLVKAEEEATARVEKAKQEAKRVTDEAVNIGKILQKNQEDKGQIEADKIINESKERVDKLKNKLFLKFDHQALRYALEIVRLTFSSHAQDTLHHSLIDEVIEIIKGIDKERFPIEIEQAKAITIRALTEQQKDCLNTMLSEKLGQKIAIEQVIDEAMIGGLIIEIGSFIIDGSLHNKFSKAVQQLGQDKQNLTF
ncbi:MAG: hypothetical protein GY853_06220 [PVC group bacterium]|nr:hypothetical protein [PVC group bacterium]